MQLPGRGRRLSEAPFTELPSLLDAMDEGLRELTDRPYVLFGFSMGAILAFELALRRQRQGHRMPVALVLAGRGAPRTVCPTVNRAAFSREKIVRGLTRLGGTDPVLLQDGPFLDVFMRIFQADFAIADAHHCATPEPLRCPMYVWGGADDPEVSIELATHRLHDAPGPQPDTARPLTRGRGLRPGVPAFDAFSAFSAGHPSVASRIRCRRLRAAIGAQRKAHRAAHTERIGKRCNAAMRFDGQRRPTDDR
ncbi:thioesterase II family protein [Verminephrobacter eiseniae]|uniref:thioesterase II family protein n=1 Tax=Verminephrobacter eiseniae TaxID=364317 RepID=UPI002242F877|nr:thioesterase domain-containing protein [Verminephrobacter eiseniae]MCW5232439.1 thioesterase [Verminephrobacter eiseniae]MCW5295995.1 thioesterase [Verminephrobacter eiseniae]MCW8187354.1 thioesterase [Verminephrobacter eiseniae]MCW8226197.1 thioesterase [Verminephrobacter eiseniae]MCW8237076.1 thioesterase [Verminephrobacter eiseniae]